MIISKFENEYAFLSNFYKSPFTIFGEGVEFQTVEHAFQALKATTPSDFQKIVNAPTPSKAKQLGRKVFLRPDWEEIKVPLMRYLTWRKFVVNADLNHKLLATKGALLVEGNTWHDNFWGDCTCEKCNASAGQNHLGLILMELRSVISFSASLSLIQSNIVYQGKAEEWRVI